jgi:hypothetical protein
VALLASASVSAAEPEFRLTGFRDVALSRQERTPQPEFKVTLYKKAGDNSQGCVVRGQVDASVLLPHIDGAKLIGTYMRCGLVGYEFRNGKQYWFQSDALSVEPADAWDRYLSSQGPEIRCNVNTGDDIIAKRSGQQLASRSFCSN